MTAASTNRNRAMIACFALAAAVVATGWARLGEGAAVFLGLIWLAAALATALRWRGAAWWVLAPLALPVLFALWMAWVLVECGRTDVCF